MDNIERNRRDMLIFLWNRRKFIVITMIIVVIITAGLTFFITPLYQSKTVVFPTSNPSVSFNEFRSSARNTMDFGEEKDAEQLIQILESNELKNLVVKKFNLYEHYKISLNDERKESKITEAFKGNVNISRTKYGSVQIEVLDKDPIMACNIANKIVEYIDTVKNQIMQQRTIPALEINIREAKLIKDKLDFYNNILDSLSDLGVINSEARKNLFEAYNEAKNQADRAYFKNILDVNVRLGDSYDATAMVRNVFVDKLATHELALEQAESDANALFNHKFLVEKAIVADKKHSPKRIVIILIVSILTFILLLLSLIIQEKLKQLKKEL